MVDEEEKFGVVRWEPDIAGKRPNIVGVKQGTVGGEHRTVEDIKMRSGTVEPLREKGKAYIVRQKRPAEISHGRNNCMGRSLQVRASSISEGAKFPVRMLAEATTAYKEENKIGEDTVMEGAVGCLRCG